MALPQRRRLCARAVRAFGDYGRLKTTSTLREMHHNPPRREPLDFRRLSPTHSGHYT
jgi:hypothetical protein